MVAEIDEFWSDAKVDPKKLEIDYGNLIGIAIYIVLRSGISLLLIDMIFIESFVSTAIMATNRAYHMTVIQTALEFIEEKLPAYHDDKSKIDPIKYNLTP